MRTKIFSSGHSFFYLIVLAVLAYFGNLVNLSLFFGVEFLFGSIFVWLVLKFYGFTWGLAASLLASSATLILWNHPYAMFIFLLETIFVGVLFRQKISNLVLLVALFWVFLGMPMVWLCYHYVLGMNTTAALTVMLKDAVNGIFNALIASLILTYLPALKWSGLQAKKMPVSFYDILFHILVALIVFPMLLVTVMIGRGEFGSIDKEVQKVTENQSEMILNDISRWRDHHVDAVVQLSKMAAETHLQDIPSLQRFTAHLTETFPDFHSMYTADSKGASLTFFPLFTPNGQSTLNLNFSYRPYVQQVKSTLQPVISDVFKGEGTVTEPVVAIGAPIMADGQFQGIATGVLNLGYISENIKKLTSRTKMHITIVDRNQCVIASTESSIPLMQSYQWQRDGEIRSLNGDMYQWLPNEIINPILRWKNSSYIKIMTLTGYSDWTVIVESPMAPYQDGLYHSYINVLSILLLSGLIAILASILISRSIVRPITQLANATTDLPNRIIGKDSVYWPDSLMSEIVILINNFKATAERLQKMFQEIQYFAYYDSLTGLPNRVLFNQEVKVILEKAGMSGEACALLFIDLDRFKMINDTLGHGNGDLLLQHIAERLRYCIGSHGTLSRMGGDEFTAVLPNMSREQTAAVAEKILNVVAEPVHISGQEVFITPSVGISMFPDDGLDHQVLIKNADQAMYAAKEQGKNMYQFYASEMDETSYTKMILETMMHKALDHDEFELYYQPKVHALTGHLTGLEALIRWQHPEKGWISPAEFIPIAEDTALINPIGEWVLRTACAQNKAWQDAGYPSVPVSVNLSVRQIMDRNLVQLISDVLQETGLDAEYLELEITENIGMPNMEYVLATLHELKQLGVYISMDDFGTGYSSLSYLKKFPIDKLKIDQSFIRDIQHHVEDKSIVKAIISMAHSLGMVVIAEGVEMEVQAFLLREMKCDEIQGFLISKPFAPDQFDQLLSRLPGR